MGGARGDGGGWFTAETLPCLAGCGWTGKGGVGFTC